MSKYKNGWPEDIKIDDLDYESLVELAGCKPDMLVSFLKRYSRFDFNKIGIILQMGAMKAEELLVDSRRHPTGEE